MLPKLALAIIERQPRFASSPYVFPGRTGGHRRSFFNPLLDLQAELGDPDWTLHDLRRTARSLMSCAAPSRIFPNGFSVTPLKACKAFMTGIRTEIRKPTPLPPWLR